MKNFFLLTIALVYLIPTKIYASKSSKVSDICTRFYLGEIDASKTLVELDLEIEDYSIGVTNAAKIICL